MDFRRRLGFDRVPVRVLQRLDRLALRFEARCPDDSRLDDCVRRVHPRYRPLAFAELLAIDAEQRSNRGLSCKIEDYLAAYPDYATIIQTVLGRRSQPDAADVTACQEPDPGATTRAVSCSTTPGRQSEAGPRYLGDYRVLRRLSDSSQQTLYLAEHRMLKRKVVLQAWMAAPTASEPESPVAVSAPNHPRWTELLTYQRFESRAFLVREWVEGLDLRSLLREHGPLSWKEAGAIVAQVAEGWEAWSVSQLGPPEKRWSQIILRPDGQIRLLVGLPNPSRVKPAASPQPKPWANLAWYWLSGGSRRSDETVKAQRLAELFVSLWLGKSPISGHATRVWGTSAPWRELPRRWRHVLLRSLRPRPWQAQPPVQQVHKTLSTVNADLRDLYRRVYDGYASS